MSVGIAGILLTAIGTVLAVLGYLYFDWLMVPGALLALIGASLLSGASEQVISDSRHRLSDSYELGGEKPGPTQPGSEEH